MGHPIQIIDVSDDVARTKPYPLRQNVKRIYVHHSGRAGAAGLRGAENTSRYVVETRKFPGPAYHYWIPFTGDAIYQLNREDRRCWHTGGRANAHGIGVCLQGNTNVTPMSEFQRRALAQLLEDLSLRHVLGKDPVCWHSAAEKHGGRAKSACPGKYATAWLQGWCAARVG